jgi:hypothetical protein
MLLPMVVLVVVVRIMSPPEALELQIKDSMEALG